MTKSIRRIVASVGILTILGILLARTSFARITGTNPTGSSADAFCVGKTAAEDCTDYLGDFLPTTNNTESLGTSALQWSNIYATTVTAGSGGIVTTGSITSGAQLSLTVQTTTQLSVLVPVSTGAIVSVQILTNGVPGSSYAVCESSGIGRGAWVYPSTSTASTPRVCN